jgi:heat shock protein HslJ
VRLALVGAADTSPRICKIWSNSMTSALRVLRLNTALVAALSLAACNGTIAGPSNVPGRAPTAAVAIETNAVWYLRSIASAEGPILTIEDPSPFTLTLGDDGTLSARADCNRASGGYRISGTTLSIGPIASTKAYCASAPTDGQFLMLLDGENVIAGSGSTLQLSSPRGTLRFVR